MAQAGVLVTLASGHEHFGGCRNGWAGDHRPPTVLRDKMPFWPLMQFSSGPMRANQVIRMDESKREVYATAHHPSVEFIYFLTGANKCICHCQTGLFLPSGDTALRCPARMPTGQDASHLECMTIDACLESGRRESSMRASLRTRCVINLGGHFYLKRSISSLASRFLAGEAFFPIRLLAKEGSLSFVRRVLHQSHSRSRSRTWPLYI